jgi:hypothetical protein
MPRDGLTFGGYLQPPAVPPDPIDEDWRGEPGPPGPAGPPGPPGGTAGGDLTGPLNFIATGSTAMRSAQDRAKEPYSVRDFGAVMNGTTSDAPAFNAAITATPSRGTIVVPSGGFNYPGGTAAWAAKPLLWQLAGNNFGTGPTPVNKIGNGLVETFLDSTTKFFARNSTVSAFGATTPTANLGPVVRIDSTIDHDGGPSGGIPGLLVSVANTAASNANVAPYGVVGQVIYNASPGVSGGCGVAGYGIRMPGAGSACPFGANFYAEDHSLLSSGAGGSLVGCEIDIRAQRLDDGVLADGYTPNPAATLPGSNRIILDLKYNRWNVSDNNPYDVATMLHMGVGTSDEIPYGSARNGIHITHKITWAALNLLNATFVGNANAIAMPSNAMVAWTPDDPAAGVPTHFSCLQYRSGKLYYVVDGVDKLSIDASGNVRAAGTITGSVTP